MDGWTRRIAAVAGAVVAGAALVLGTGARAAEADAEAEAQAQAEAEAEAAAEADAADILSTPARPVEGAAMRGEEEEVGSSLSFAAGVDFATAYFYRGIPQEVNGYIFQPYASLGISLYEPPEESALPVGVGLSFATWNSIHSNLASNPWYESDFSAGISFDLPAGISTGVTYVYLYSPAGGDIFAEEIDVPITIDETKLLGLGDMPLGLTFSPSALFAFEIDGGSDGLGGAGEKGIYLELGLAPSVTLEILKDYPLTLSLPVKLGLSLDDYYEDSTGGNDTFGYFDLAVSGSIPLAFVPKRFGSWSLTGTVHFLWLGDSAETIGKVDFGVGGDDFNVYGVVGLAVE